MTLEVWALLYVFFGAATGGWTVGIGGLGRDWLDRVLIAAMILLWPLTWLFAAGARLEDVLENRK